MVRSRIHDPIGPADPRMAPYLEGRHHPTLALPPRVMFVCLEGDRTIGYIGGHLTERYECDGELQYLFVAAPHRRRGIASEMLASLAGWFTRHDAARVCVDVTPENQVARAFYSRLGAVELNPHWMVWNDISTVLA